MHPLLSVQLHLVSDECYFLIDQLDLLLVLVNLLRKLSISLLDDQVQCVVFLSSFLGSEVHGFEVLADRLVDPSFLCLQGLLKVSLVDVFINLLPQVLKY